MTIYELDRYLLYDAYQFPSIVKFFDQKCHGALEISVRKFIPAHGFIESVI